MCRDHWLQPTKKTLMTGGLKNLKFSDLKPVKFHSDLVFFDGWSKEEKNPQQIFSTFAPYMLVSVATIWSGQLSRVKRQQSSTLTGAHQI